MHNQKVFIIAEAGVNHNGRLDLALKLCDAAAKAGADAVKFQTFRTEHNVLRDCGWVEYQQRNAGEAHSHWDMLRALELSDNDFLQLKQHCDSIGIEFISTPSERESLKLLLKLNVRTLKLSSCDVTNTPLLRAVGRARLNVLLSTGMCELDDIAAAIDIITAAGTPRGQLTLLHCHSAYPTSMSDANLRVMVTLRERFGLRVGFSDHTEGCLLAAAAVALGAEVVEKHFTLDRSLPGPDHKMSLDPHELETLVRNIRDVETGLGDGVKRISPCEREILKAYDRGIVAAAPIRAGETFSEDNLTVKRPCRGINVRQWDKIIGISAPRDFKKDEPIILE